MEEKNPRDEGIERVEKIIPHKILQAPEKLTQPCVSITWADFKTAESFEGLLIPGDVIY